MNLQHKATYRTGLFDSENLTTFQKIDDTLNEFGAAINRRNYVRTLDEILDRDHVVELVVSRIGEHVALKEWMLEDFPHSAQAFDTSFTYRILSRLSKFLQFYSSSFSIAHLDLVNAAPKAFQVLSSMTFLERDEKQTDKGAVAMKMKSKGSQKDAKQARRAAHDAATVDYRLFAALALPVPKSREDADRMCEELFARLKLVLTVFFEDMRSPSLVETVKARFVLQEPHEVLQAIETDVPRVQDEESALAAATPTSEEPPAAYPMVQPLKGALYFDTPEGFGKWRIYLASKASADLRHYRGNNPKVFNTVKNTIMFLSHGNFLPDKHKPLKGSGTIVPVYEAKMGGDLRLIYIVDCITDYDNISEIQALRIFGVYNHAQMDKRLWTSVSLYLSKRNAIYRQRCLHRTPAPGVDKYCFDPVTFSGPGVEDDTEVSMNEIPSLPGINANELHQIVSLEKYVMLSQELLDCIESNRPAAFPFELSKYEQTIVQHPQSCYVLGRSGTGKTTTMLFKMLLHERTYQLSGSQSPRPRQLFVTKSRVLAKRVEEQFMAYFTTLLTASHTEHLYPSSAILAQTASTDIDQEHIFQNDDDESWQNHLPRCFSELQDYHFPLFIPFEKLCAMIEADIDASKPIPKNNYFVQDHEFGGTDPRNRKGNLINYDRFLSHYWPHLPQNLKKNFHPMLVFTEFMGVISGSEAAIISADGYLSREAYQQLSGRYATFTEHRDAVYGLYKAYRKIKTEHGDIDLAERTQNIIRSFAENSSLLQKVTHLYVDETQDNLLIDTLLLRMLCSNSEGLFWAGDTAQTISAGSAFRFNDLKAFLYRIEEKHRKESRYSAMGRPREPRMFQLSVNFRSHAGIVNCAHAIVQIITSYWKNAIDSLQPERGKASGAKPIFYNKIYAGYVHEGYFMKRGANIAHGPVVELGAHQCILVRDESAKQRLLQKMGRDVGLVLTLYESKGLEFNDVFLYNFFQDSTVQASHWRLLLNNVPNGLCRGPAPTFDPTRHAALCSELKCLYVAVTRARNNFRIADESDVGAPMQTLWASRGYIVTCNPGEESIDFAAPSSDQSDWADRAKSFFDNNQWLLAKQCYERAGRNHSAAVANSYYLQEVARQTPVEGNGAKRKLAFTSAAEAFASCADNVHEYEMKNRYLRRSGECYEEGLLYLRAARTYRQAEFLNEAVLCFKRAGSFDDVHDIIRQSSAQLTDCTLESVRDVTRLHFVAKQNYEKVHQLFDDPDEEKEFLEDRNLDLAQLDLLLRHGRKTEAAELHLAENRILEAVDLFLEEGSIVSISRATDCILQGLWKLMPVGIVPPDEAETGKLFERCDKIPEDAIKPRDQDEISMFRLIHSRSIDKLCRMADTFLGRHDLKAAFLCLDHIFVNPPQLSNRNLDETEKQLRRFSAYVHILREFSTVGDLVEDSRISILFGLQLLDDVDGSVIISSDSPIAGYFHGRKEGNIVVKREAFVQAFRQSLQTRLLARVTQENDVARHLSDFQSLPCMRHVVERDCKTESPCPRPHLAPDVQWYRRFVNVHLLQIIIYQTIFGLQRPAEMKAQQKFWILKLYEVLNPASHHFGPTCGIMQQSLQDVQAATSVVLDWVRSLSFTLEFNPRHEFLTIAMQCASLAFALDKKEAVSFMARCHFVTSRCPIDYLRGPAHQNALQEMLLAMELNNRSSVATGIQFLRHIVEVGIPVNMPVLCSFIERICSQLIVCNCLQWRGDLHSIILPRTWLSSLLLDLDIVEAQHQDCSYFWPILQPLQTLLRALFFPTGQSPMKIEPEFRSLDRQSKIVRGVYIARICRVLGLRERSSHRLVSAINVTELAVGSNIQLEDFQQDILGVFWSIRQELGHGFSPLYGGYFFAEDFYKVLLMTRRSMMDSPFDNMVQLLHAHRLRYPVTDIVGLSRIVYSKPEELLERLQGAQLLQTSVSAIPDTTHDQVEHTVVDVRPAPDEEEHIHLDIDSGPPIVKPEDENFIPDTVINQSMYLGHSELEVKSASVIQKTYRGFKDRQRSMEGVNHGARTRQWFLQYRDFIQSRPLLITKEMVVHYLGPLAHLLAVLDAVQTAIPRAKKQLRMGLLAGNSHPEELEGISAKQTAVANAFKALKQYQSQLAPTDNANIPLDLETLKKKVEEVMEVVMSIQSLLRLPKDVIKDLQLVKRGVLQPPKSPKLASLTIPAPSDKGQRPALVMENLLDLIEERWEDH